MGKLGKESLVQWSSNSEIHKNTKTKLLRPITYMYAAAIIAIFVMLFIMGGTKEYMILDINKEARLYKIKAENEITNSYLMFFKNTEPNRHTYKLKMVGKNSDNFTIKRFTELSLKEGASAKEVLIISTKEILSEHENRDTIIPITLKAYSTTEPERVFLFKELSFIYPGKNSLK